jgi:hypothetical protein
MCERLEGEAAAGEPINLELYGRLTDRLGRALQRLGLERRPRDVTPTLADILAEDEAEERQRAAEEAARAVEAEEEGE